MRSASEASCASASPERRSSEASARARLVFGIALGVALFACATDPGDSSTPEQVVTDIDPAGYEAVQPVLEKHCGSAECHGNLPRGLRVYGASGLRLNAPTPTAPTTPDERRATYVSILALQPEKTDALARKSPRFADDAYDLLLLSKPLGRERHRPGATLRKGEAAEKCITSWLVGALDRPACTTGAAF
jgi:hypothetical protein